MQTGLINMFYPWVRPLLFSLEAERAHDLTFKLLPYLPRFLFAKLPVQPRTVMGLEFKNPLGLAAGLDKNADYLMGLDKLGFGFIEIGTVTPLPQPGNPKPRLFRLPRYHALINRMGFNGKGADYVAQRLETTPYKGILGINIGKNKETPIERAGDDYQRALRVLYPFANYITINISSPNTPDLRNLQFNDYLEPLLHLLQSEQASLTARYQRRVPFAIKIAPDLTAAEIADLASLFNRYQVDAVIATNTSVDRKAIAADPLASEAGGLSGAPLAAQSTEVIRQLRQSLQADIPIIGVGGISNAQDAADKYAAGASLLQVYTGLIYQGPGLLKTLLQTD
jgi:dihydroorotate dehydrogenase